MESEKCEIPTTTNENLSFIFNGIPSLRIHYRPSNGISVHSECAKQKEEKIGP